MSNGFKLAQIAYDDGYKKGVEEMRERCAKAVCPRCAGDWPLDLETGEHHYPESGHILLPEGRCLALGILKHTV